MTIIVKLLGPKCQKQLRLQLKASRGDTDLYVGNGLQPQPRRPHDEHTVYICVHVYTQIYTFINMHICMYI